MVVLHIKIDSGKTSSSSVSTTQATTNTWSMTRPHATLSWLPES